MKGTFFIALITPALCSASCGTKIVEETQLAYVTCAAGGQDCGPPGAGTPRPSATNVRNSLYKLRGICRVA